MPGRSLQLFPSFPCMECVCTRLFPASVVVYCLSAFSLFPLSIACLLTQLALLSDLSRHLHFQVKWNALCSITTWNPCTQGYLGAP